MIDVPQQTIFDDIHTIVETESNQYLSIEPNNPNSSIWSQSNSTCWMCDDDWNCSVTAMFQLTSTVTDFHVKETLCAMKGEKEVFKREYVTVIQRDLM